MLDIACATFDMTLLIMFFNAIMNSRKTELPYPAFLLIFLASEGVLYTASLFFSANTGDNHFIVMNVISIVTLFLQTYLYESRLIHRIFATISFQLFGILSEIATYAIGILLPRSLSEKMLENNAFCAIVSKLFLFLFVVITNLLFLRKKRAYTAQYPILICFMPIVSIFILISSVETALLSRQIFPLMGAIGLLFANAVNYFLLNNILRVNELEKEREHLTQQLDFQASKYQQISIAYRNTRSIMHDTKKHYFYISENIKNKNYDVIENYLKSSMEDIEQSYNKINTGNLVIDAFVSNHLSAAEKEGIGFSTDIQVDPSNIQIDDYDFSIILGNLLDNSLEACRNIKYPFPRNITVSIHTSSRELLIHIFNTVPREDEDSTRNRTKDKLQHGYGTTNIENITLKYYGIYNHYIEKGKYHAIVAIPCNMQV